MESPCTPGWLSQVNGFRRLPFGVKFLKDWYGLNSNASNHMRWHPVWGMVLSARVRKTCCQGEKFGKILTPVPLNSKHPRG
jgi:hypothetical protein